MSASLETECCTARPFVKWAGGKRQLLDNLELDFPMNFGTYYEPFLGGGAVFFRLANKLPPFKAVLSDINEELIITYNVVEKQVEALILALKEHKINYEAEPENYFYKVRKIPAPDLSDLEKAARLLFLNKTCFNGLYRVNSKGTFNVPFGRYKNPKICDENNLRAVSCALNLSKAKVISGDFVDIARQAGKDDFVYFDPPYHPLSATASFTSYTENGFNGKDQTRLANLCKELGERGCNVVLSNSNTPEIRALYKNPELFKIREVQAMRAINCKGALRSGHSELIITTTKAKRQKKGLK
jgi:DNA adenine methylase